MAGSAVGLASLASTPETRAVSASTLAAVTCGVAADCTGGQPSIQPIPITSAAATAPESGAITQGETAAWGLPGAGCPAAPSAASGSTDADAAAIVSCGAGSA